MYYLSIYNEILLLTRRWMGLEDAMENKADREMHAMSHTWKVKYTQNLANWGGWRINDGRVDLVCILYEKSDILD